MGSPLRAPDGAVVKWIGTAMDIDDRKEVERERHELLTREQAARAEAELANRAKDEFLARVSHELAAPLAALFMWIEVLRTGRPGDRGAAIEAIDESARAQAKLIEDLLDVARGISGKLRMHVEPIDPRAAIAAAVRANQPRADAKDIRIASDLAPDARTILGDATRVQQIVSNLIANAIKFTPDRGLVEVRLDRAGPAARITVRDTGQGIRADFLPQLFMPFRQADGSSTRSHGGLGLGLAIVRELVVLHGGAIHAESPGEGKGSTFTVTLPISSAPSAKRNSGEQPEAEIVGLRVLVIDDDDRTREALELVLEHCGAEVSAASSAQDALVTIARARPDVLLCDIAMPGEDGYSLVRKVRALMDSELAATPAVALTAHAREEDRLRALDAGFQAHIAKPVEIGELVTTLANVTGRL